MELTSIIAMEVILFGLIFHSRHWKRFVAMNPDFYLYSEIGMWRSSRTCIKTHTQNVWRSSKHLKDGRPCPGRGFYKSIFLFLPWPALMDELGVDLFYNTPSVGWTTLSRTRVL